jgi:sec-independent protein translocase protein TatA
MGSMSITHWLIVLVVVLIFFGKDRISGVMKEMGKGVRGFKDGLNGKDEAKPDDKIPPPSTPPSA